MYLRKLTIAVNKAGFLFNPSRCSTENATMGLTSASYSGATSTANASSALTFTQCGSLGFNPTVAFSATPDSLAALAASRPRSRCPQARHSRRCSARWCSCRRASRSRRRSIPMAPSRLHRRPVQQREPAHRSHLPCGLQAGHADRQLAHRWRAHRRRVPRGDGLRQPRPPLRLCQEQQLPDREHEAGRHRQRGRGTGITTADFSGAPQVPFTSFAMTLRVAPTPPSRCRAPVARRAAMEA